jgi:putative flippase GtrA
MVLEKIVSIIRLGNQAMEKYTMHMCLRNKTIHEFCKYGLVGGIGALIDFGLYTILVIHTSLYYILANAISFSIGTLVVYYLQKVWTFQYQSDKDAYLFTRFASVVMVTYLLNNVILVICIEFLLISSILSKIIQIIISFGWGYTMNKIFVFKDVRI